MARFLRLLGISLVVIAFTLSVTGCGSHTVPSVVGERLDLAESTVKDSGLGYEEVGGGIFGIIERSNWTVCQQEPSAGTKTSSKVKLVVSRSC